MTAALPTKKHPRAPASASPQPAAAPPHPRPSPPVRAARGGSEGSRHLAAIHVLAAKCGLSDGDYRCLLRQLTGKDSAKLLSIPEREKVREHLQLLARRMGVGRADQSARFKTAARPTERKIWALWGALGAAGKLRDARPAALHRFVQRQAGVSHLRFCTVAQQLRLIEALKGWLERGAA